MSENTESQMLQRYNTLIGVITPLGAAYAPPSPVAALAAMIAKAAAAQVAIDALDERESEEDVARDARQAIYEPLAALASNIYQYCKALGWSENQLDGLQSKIRELRGDRAQPKPADDPNTPEDESKTGGSSSQTAFASREGTWSEIVSYLEENGYVSNEAGMKMDDLSDLRDQMRDANQAVATASGAAGAARQTRDEVFYTGAGSNVESAVLSKNYLRAIHEDTQAWATAKNLEFSLPRRLR
jgi:hypothetical protein